MRRIFLDDPYVPGSAAKLRPAFPTPTSTVLTVTVVICAHAGSGWIDLNAAIASAARQPEAREVIVVVDHDDALLRRTSERWGSLTTVVSNVGPRGLAGARNTALGIASGDVIAFLDDDAAAEPGWLAQMLTHYSDDKVVAVGGSARPVWPTPVAPVRLPPELLCAVGCTWVYSPAEQAALSSVVDCSVSFRRSALIAVGGFADGRSTSTLVSRRADELAVWSRLRASDPRSQVVFEPSSRVTHRVDGDGMRWSRLASSFFAVGMTRSALLDRAVYGGALRFEGRFVAVMLPRAMGRELLAGHPTAALSIVVAVVCGAVGFGWGAVRRMRADVSSRAATADTELHSSRSAG
ncbi:glycosyltransferase family 2 protein [Glaciihabitans sp. dw_435]|uniref:glycosyltransferase n=1 Tax=Glaciihabitans sp. dw_435 TaxID=2720081 RepID=UPI001BD5FF2D|nr:glycosyltransferase family 2 protein [Glaciihabitans sp. dw_435]